MRVHTKYYNNMKQINCKLTLQFPSGFHSDGVYIQQVNMLTFIFTLYSLCLHPQRHEGVRVRPLQHDVGGQRAAHVHRASPLRPLRSRAPPRELHVPALCHRRVPHQAGQREPGGAQLRGRVRATREHVLVHRALGAEVQTVPGELVCVCNFYFLIQG
jgi:hypothetical protein